MNCDGGEVLYEVLTPRLDHRDPAFTVKEWPCPGCPMCIDPMTRDNDRPAPAVIVDSALGDRLGRLLEEHAEQIYTHDGQPLNMHELGRYLAHWLARELVPENDGKAA